MEIRGLSTITRLLNISILLPVKPKPWVNFQFLKGDNVLTFKIEKSRETEFSFTATYFIYVSGLELNRDHSWP
jgi:hypothetical protein